MTLSWTLIIPPFHLSVVSQSKLSSAHVYLRLPPGKPYGDWDNLPPALVMDAAQLVKANSIEGMSYGFKGL